MNNFLVTILTNIKRSFYLLREKISYFYARMSANELFNSFSVASHLTYTERLKLYQLAKEKKVIAEIGSFVGASACCFGASIKNAGNGKIICIDTWNNDAMSEGNRDTWSEFIKNTKAYSKFIAPIRGFSTNVAQAVYDISPFLDLLFIDGDHSYEGVKTDWETYKVFLKAGSIVVFHDYGWAEGVKKVVHQDVMPMVIKSGQLPNMWWGQIGGLH